MTNDRELLNEALRVLDRNTDLLLRALDLLDKRGVERTVLPGTKAYPPRCAQCGAVMYVEIKGIGNCSWGCPALCSPHKK